MVTRGKLGFFDGVRAPFDGLRFVVGTPSTWMWALVPLLFVILLAALGIWGLFHLAAHFGVYWVWIGRATTVWQKIVAGLVDLVALIVAVFVAYFLAVPLSGFALERIVRKRERALVLARHAEVSSLRAAMRSLGASLVSLFGALVAFVLFTVVDLAVPPATIVTAPLRVLVAALLLAWDVLDYPLGMRPMSLGARVRWMRENFSASLGFGLALWALFFIPGANLLLLPAGVAGAARLVGKTEKT